VGNVDVFCSKFRTLSNSGKIWKSVKIWQSYKEFKGGNFFETQCSFSAHGKRGNFFIIIIMISTTSGCILVNLCAMLHLVLRNSRSHFQLKSRWRVKVAIRDKMNCRCYVCFSVLLVAMYGGLHYQAIVIRHVWVKCAYILAVIRHQQRFLFVVLTYTNCTLYMFYFNRN